MKVQPKPGTQEQLQHRQSKLAGKRACKTEVDEEFLDEFEAFMALSSGRIFLAGDVVRKRRGWW